ncbi:undecaprenyldiphospho-muramoylpentapeptide beta-N-acetylglucosaminyltransferase [Tumebacillus permanentifrigoris]|uniref:UDP-N-acetylglucosamine--N-acetylmuramyl-(pentapeptide) pyrophosphoryl-undecaprenol N-acetylglucosamine transferase n=1 Tax=Tumebacillus permanentifrigoris TaxID=378543 RepID=A0A316DEH3_9BACL|nr:undecaprenyldiphospho-muramoylpentapeptide beta-N-acetylglucosaminyltransferase [Tumebacillus permanentifrigoris]PWK15952.1 UDP-N-acetylglucosamine-N-acetylmuramylpentapeptide N-acetylglucosamine transferase [Tumebacillus permanentifrigoris]
MKKKIVLTGGGSAGHVTGNLALLPKLQAAGWDIEYIGSFDGIEREMIERVQLPYHPIAVGKLRRYFDLKNLKDPFKVIQGVFQAYSVLRRVKPSLVFSKGGFVAVPVVMGAWLNRIPVVIHESDLTPGLANKLCAPCAEKVCVTFAETLKHIEGNKAVHTGAPIREDVLQGDAQRGFAFTRLTPKDPVLLIIGGSLGSEKINQAIRANLDVLLEKYQIVHICGKGHVDPALEGRPRYRQYEFVSQELPDLFAMTDLFVSRAGSNAIFEFLALKKPHVLIPLSRAASRGDQILNAKSFEKAGYSRVLFEEDLTTETLLTAIQETHANRAEYIAAMQTSTVSDAVGTIMGLIEKHAQKQRK